MSLKSTTKRFLVYSGTILVSYIIIFTILAINLRQERLYTFDLTIINWIQGFIYPQVTSLMLFFTFLGSTTGIILLAILLLLFLFWKRQGWEALFLCLATGGGAIFIYLLKHIFQRERPSFFRLIEESGYSFPSGHSMISFVFLGMLAYLALVHIQKKKVGLCLALLASVFILLIGVSRIYLGVHFPSDVLAGFTAGGVWLSVCIMGLRVFLDKQAGIY